MNYFNIPYKFTDENNANVFCIGSIIRRAKKGDLVLGSGLMFESEKPSPLATYRFVRGPRTRKRILELGGDCPEIYCDPALLLPLFCEESVKKYDLGIVPHFVDYAFVKKEYPSYRIIDVINNDPLSVAKDISECRSIISSSLHGIIAAHSYNIPAAWIKFSNKIKGDDIKFKDYYESHGLYAELSTIKDPIFTQPSKDITPIVDIFKEFEKQ